MRQDGAIWSAGKRRGATRVIIPEERTAYQADGAAETSGPTTPLGPLFPRLKMRLVQQGLPDRLHLLERRPIHGWERELQPRQRVHHRARHHQPREWLVVGGYDVPGRMRTAGRADRVLVRGHVLVPELALGNVAFRELPALGGLLDARQEALALLLLRNMQEELQDQRATARQMAFKG